MAESVPTTNSSPRAWTGVGLVDSYLPTHPSQHIPPNTSFPTHPSWSSTAIMPQTPQAPADHRGRSVFETAFISMIGKGGATFRSIS